MRKETDHQADVHRLYQTWALVGGYPSLTSAEYQSVLRSCSSLQTPGKNVLDVGCGIGLVGAELKGLGHQVTGVDLVSEALREAVQAKRIDRAIQADFLNFNFEAAKFDVVVFWGVLLLIFDLDAVFAKCHEVLSSGGQVLVVDHHSANPYTKMHFGRPDWVDRLLEGRSNTARRALNEAMLRQAAEKYIIWSEPSYWNLYTRHPHRLINGIHSVARTGFSLMHQVWRPNWAYNFISMHGSIK